jgi:hypothetical protein
MITGDIENKKLLELQMANFGRMLAICPPDQYISLNPTTAPGGTSGVYFSLVFQLRKWEYQVQRASQSIEITPAYTQYYQMVLRQKEEFETKIKAGLASAAQSVADLELLKHDERKYREFLGYFGMKVENGKVMDDPKSKDEHSLKAIFVDQVDVHTGEGVSMRSIVSRWPTLITDFMRLADTDTDMDVVRKKLDISKAEAVVLVTKNKLYQQWKKMFGPEIKNRYERIAGLIRSREKSVDEYREWLKPVIARHQLLSEGLSDKGMRKDFFRTTFMTSPGSTTSLEFINVWAWKDITSPELAKIPGELIAKKPIDPYDDWTKKNLIFNKEHGLVTEYPWITDKWIKDQYTYLTDPTRRMLIAHKPYYTFFDITFMRGGIRLPSGAELEDSLFIVNTVFMSQNALFAKLLELRAKQETFEKYVNELLGIEHKIEGTPPEPKKEKDYTKPFRDFFSYFNLNFQFFKRGPYERDFRDRVTKYYLKAMGSERYVPIKNLIKEKFSYGVL